MSKSLVEKYQQILAEDPGSLVFVELAKALLDRGDSRQALEVCVKGVEQHPDSVVGRVLWGKALIVLGKPAEAMEQFDKAIAIERENPYAYNLIGEVLLHKGLYRSAVPILKKAMALQPNDLRVRQWLDQAQRGVGGGKAAAAPQDRDITQVNPVDPATLAAATPPPAGDLEKTLTEVKAYVPASGAEAVVPGLTDVFKSLAAREGTATPSAAAPAPKPPFEQTPTDPAPAPAAPAKPSAEQAPAIPAGLDAAALTPAWPPEEDAAKPSPELVGGVTDVFKSLAAREAEATEKLPVPAAGPIKTPLVTPMAMPPEPAAPEPKVTPAATPAAADLLPGIEAVGDLDADRTAPGLPPQLASPPREAKIDPSGAKGDGPRTDPATTVEVSPELMAPPARPKPPPLAPPTLRPKPKTPGLLDELPDESMPAVSQEVPSVVIAPDAAQDIAREYERELRERLLKTPPPSFLRKHWLSVSLAAAATLALGAGSAVYLHTRHKNRGVDLIELRSQSFRSLTLDTPPALRDAIDLANRALELVPDDPDARSSRAFAEASLFFRAGREPGRRTAAQKDLSLLKQAHPALALASAYYLAVDPGELEEARAPLLAAAAAPAAKGFEGAEVLSIAGRLALAAGKTEEALARFKSALEADSNHVGTLAALGDYYLSQSDYEQALRFFSRAKELSPGHLPALLGYVKTRLALDEGDPTPELVLAQKAFESSAGAWPTSWKADLDLAEGRVLAVTGKAADATQKLAAGASTYPNRAGDFLQALGVAEVLSGSYDKAERAFSRALEKRPQDPELKEELARALIALGRPTEALKRTEQVGGDERRLRVVRGLARLEMGQPAKAREELALTMRNGKVPAEAAIYLAMVDAATGQRDTARAVLESAVKSGKGRAAARVALGRLYLEDGRDADAQAQFTAAAQDRRDWEGACGLGRLALKANRFADAQTQFSLALDRNKFHQEAQVGLGQALLALGETKKAQASFQAALALGPSAPGRRGLARALLAQGDLSGARKELLAAARAEPNSPELPRLFAQLSLAAGDAQEAIKSLEKAAKANPADPAGFCELGELLLKVGNQPAARKSFESALKLERADVRARLGMVAASLPTPPKSAAKEAEALVHETESAIGAAKARPLALLARVKIASGDAKGALAVAQSAVKADDASADAHLALGLAAKALKNPELALKELQRVVGLDPTIAEAHLALADSLVRDPNELVHAQSEVESYLRIAPTGPDAPVAKKFLAVLKRKIEAAAE